MTLTPEAPVANAVQAVLPKQSRTTRKPSRPADVAAVGAVLGLAALLPLPAAVRGLLLAAFIVLAPGAALLTWVNIPARARLGLIPVLGMSLITMITVGAIWSYRWHPRGILILCIVAVGLSCVLWYRKNSWPRPRRFEVRLPPIPWRAALTNPSILISVVALVVWAASIPGLPGVEASLYGLLFSGTGPLLAVAIVLGAFAFVLAIRSAHRPAAILALGTVIVVGRLTTAVGTEVPLLDWSYKHIAIVDYIVTHGAIQPYETDIYAAWPGFFVIMAWFSKITGLAPITLAHVCTPIWHILIALIVFSAARVLKAGWRVALTAAFIVEILNWVAQDYFAPQAWTIVLAFGVLALLLLSIESRTAGILALIPFAAIVPTHQLTPFWLLLTGGLLVITKRAKPWWVLVVMALMAGLFVARNMDSLSDYSIFSGSNPLQNAESNYRPDSSQAKLFTSVVCRSLSAAMFVSAAAAAVWLRRHRRPVLSLCIIAFSPLLLLLGQSYGGEAIFRVFLYGLLGVALLIAPVLVLAIGRSGGGHRVATGAATAWLTLATLAGMNANVYVSLWPIFLETREQIALMDALTKAAEPGTRIMRMGPGGLPTRTGEQYVRLTLRNPSYDQPFEYQEVPGKKSDFPTAEQLSGVEWTARHHPYDSYIMFSAQSNNAIRYYDLFRPQAVAEFQSYLYKSTRWELVYRNGETVIFRHKSFASYIDKWTWTPWKTTEKATE
ncbi:hypothetical protein [Mycobacterium sp. 141]|uniref:hypothetical protein n=1 Tax=Mycobacterium sp. 141 TaxID=1120797 RepID=UPI00039D65FB|nr:hypothetical protein [Mycobacterium sp. 141]